MTLRARILLGFGVVVLVPLLVFGLRVRTEMASRLTAEYERRVKSAVFTRIVVAANCPAALAQTIERMLAARPYERFKTPAILAAALT